MSTSEQQQIEQLKSDALALRQEAAGLTIGDANEYVAAVEWRKSLKNADRKAEDFFKPMKVKIRELEKSIRDAEKSVRGPIQESMNICDNAIVGWQATQARHADEQQAVLQAQADVLGEEAPLIKIEPLIPKVEGFTTRDVWSAELEDMATLAKFCVENPSFLNLLQLNGPSANALARSQHNSMNVPGLRSVCKAVPVQKG
jgi:hypothetical protein